jgi:DNA-binding NarL/FixJ family response regulator
MIRVLLADDQEVLRVGMRMLLESEPDIEVVGEASTGSEAVDLARSVEADVILMDVQMPDMDGIEATRRLTEDTTTTARILIVTTFQREDYLLDALRAGASGFLLKTTPPDELVDAVHVVAEGKSLLDPTITGQVIDWLAAGEVGEIEPSPLLEHLTDREVDVLIEVAAGLSNSEIGEKLFVAESTVKTHVSSVLSKLHLRDRVQAVVFAYENGVVRAGD